MINTKNSKQGNINHAIKTIVATLGVVFGIGGIGHGFSLYYYPEFSYNRYCSHVGWDCHHHLIVWLYA